MTDANLTIEKPDRVSAELPGGSGVSGVAPWRLGVVAARANRWPGLMLSVFAVGLLLSYWYVPTATAALDAVAGFKDEQGWRFVLVSTALFGGVIPWIVQRLRPATRHFSPWPHLWFLAAFWGIKGVEIDLLYRVQAIWFGHGSDPATVTKKIAFDMGLYAPIWAMPTTLAAYAFMNNRFSFRGLSGLDLRRWISRVLLPITISNWSVWVPAVMVIYCLPLALQLPVQNLVLCFWSLLLVFQVSASTPRAPITAPIPASGADSSRAEVNL